MHVTGNTTALAACDDTQMLLFGQWGKESAGGVHVCEQGGDGLTLWEPRSVQRTTVSSVDVLSSGRKRGYWASPGKKKRRKKNNLNSGKEQ